MGHRWYDPTTGRFLTRDPAGKGPNFFAYGGNDPINHVDPVGFDWIYVDEDDGFRGGHSRLGHEDDYGSPVEWYGFRSDGSDRNDRPNGSRRTVAFYVTPEQWKEIKARIEAEDRAHKERKNPYKLSSNNCSHFVARLMWDMVFPGDPDFGADLNAPTDLMECLWERAPLRYGEGGKPAVWNGPPPKKKSGSSRKKGRN